MKHTIKFCDCVRIKLKVITIHVPKAINIPIKEVTVILGFYGASTYQQNIW